jgi:imidazoleglycerol-phosphate dehydratase
MARSAERTRTTNETSVSINLNLDGSGSAAVSTGIGFLDHMLDAVARHAHLDLELKAEGDLAVDDHHTAEDCAIVFGTAVDDALADRAGIARFGSAYAPLDESLARVVIDLSGRPSATIEMGLCRESIGQIACENIVHFFESFAMSARCALHVDVLRGRNDHHRAEAAFKAFALALRQAVRVDGDQIPSTKGTLS